MEYKELIAISKKAADEWRNDHAFYQAGTLIDSLCSALETMQAERDTALRAQKTPLDRSQWEGCEHCKGDLEGYTAQFRDADGRSRRLYIPEGEATIVAPGKYNHQFCIPIKYCPFCGRPITEEAWVELERRINDGTTD